MTRRHSIREKHGTRSTSAIGRFFDDSVGSGLTVSSTSYVLKTLTYT